MLLRNFNVKEKMFDLLVVAVISIVLCAFFSSCQWTEDDLFIKEEVINCRDVKCQKVLV